MLQNHYETNLYYKRINRSIGRAEEATQSQSYIQK